MSGDAGVPKPVESVWDYPRPPRIEVVPWRITVVHAGVTVVDAPHTRRVLETSQPPAYYVAEEFIDMSLLDASAHHTFCEWKGLASYADVVIGSQRVRDATWTYREPTPAFVELAGHWAFYAQRLDECRVDGELVAPNEGSFYGGWITSNITGPFKGGPGTSHW